MPRWDIDSIFPGLESEAFQQELDDIATQIAQIESILQRTGIDRADARDPVSAWNEFEAAYSAVYERYRTAATYVMMHVTADSRNETAQAKESELQQLAIRLRKIDTKATAWIGTVDLNSVIAQSESARNLSYLLKNMQISAQKLMSPAEEDLATELRESGGTAWSKLHGNLSSQIEVEVGGEVLPMPAVRNLAYDPDAERRREGYQAELDAWKKNEVAMAAAMNGIKGEFGRLCRRRGWDSPLDQALFDARIDRQTLDAMLGAARKSFPTFRRYLQAKAKLLGKEKLPWYDLFAPLPGAGKPWPYDLAEDFIERNFRGYSDKLGDFARMSFDRTWTDAEPRIGKRDGAFCAGLRPGESRILMNYKPAFGSVSTLAHELGHAYHNLCLRDRLPLQRSTPMTLAETASIFCETLIREAGLKEGTDEERLEILEASLQGSTQVVVDITSRFLYEQEVFERRAERELSPREHCDIMIRAQKATYGDGLDEELLHPYMWAVKPHYYSPGRSFYNFPYMFGLLFGLGLYAIYEKESDAFRDRYDDLLSSTGMYDAADLAGRFGIDIRDEAFWAGSLCVIGKEIERFESLAH